MLWLTHKYWKDFVQKDGKFDGRRFESLVNSLLPILGLKLKETKISWDRARDFEDRQKKIWAECKIYKENISIKILSNTLVMAIIDKPNKIYFFSYSKLNDNAICHLAQFQTSANLPIYVFDDTSLESLILTNPASIKQFFPTYLSGERKDEILPDIRAGFSKDPEIEYYEDSIEDPRNKELFIYSVFSIDVFIRNFDTKKQLEGRISIESSEAANNFLLLNKNIRSNNHELVVKVGKGGLFFHRFYFKSLRCGTVSLPIMTFHSHQEERLIRLNPDKVKVSAIIKTNLIGKSYIEFLHKFKLLIQGRHQPVFLNLYGESGTGKSRMLKEFTEVLFEEDFAVIKYDGEDFKESRFKDFIRKVFSKIFKLPIVSADVSNDLQNEFIFDILYNEQFDHTGKIPEIVDAFLNGIGSRKYSLLIDNIQNFDEPTAIFLDNLITRSEQMPFRIVLAFCFNTNLLYKDTKNFELFERLMYKGSQAGDIFKNQEIVGFDGSDYELYLDSCIRPINARDEPPFSIKYPETTILFKSKVLNRPLFIEQTLLYLEQEGAIKRIEDKFYVSDVGRFHKALNNDFPSDLFALISRRWEIFKAHGNRRNGEKQLLVEVAIRFFCYFNVVKYKDAQAFGISNESISTLRENGFIEIDERETITFYHHQIFLFFRKRVDIQSSSEHELYKRYLEDQELSGIYFHQYFIISSKLSAIDSQLIERACQALLADFHYSDFLIQFSNSLFEVLIGRKKTLGINTQEKLSAFLRIGKIVQIFQSMEERRSILSRANQYVILNKEKFLVHGVPYFDFIHGYANACITVHKDEEAIPLLTNAINDFDDSNFNSNLDRDKSLGKLFNRLCVVYKAVGLSSEAFHYGNLSQELAVRTDDRDLQVRNYIDLANIYGRKLSAVASILNLWNNAVAIYHDHYDELRYQKSMVQLYESQLKILSGQYEEGIELMRDGVRYCEAHSAHFFAVKYLLLEIICEITFKRDAGMNLDRLFRLVYKAKDWAMRYQISRSYWKTILIEGRLHLLKDGDNTSDAAECFIQSIDQFLLAVKSSSIEEYNLPVFEHMAYFFRLNRYNSLFSVFLLKSEKLKSVGVKSLISKILNSTDQEMADLQNSHKPLMVYNDGKFDFPVIG